MYTLSIAFKFVRLSRRRVPTNFQWTRGYLSNNEVDKSRFQLDLTELSDNPKVQNYIVSKFIQLQENLLERKEKDLLSLAQSLMQSKEDKISSLMQSNEDKILSLMQDNKKEILSKEQDYKKEISSLMQDNKKEILSLMQDNKKEILSLAQSKDKEYLSLMNELNDLKHLAENRAQMLLQMKHKSNVRGALEFIRAQDTSIVFTEPVDKALKRLSQDENFIKTLREACEDNGLRYDDVQNCIRGLYHSASKHFHGREQQVVIDSRDWSSNEVFVLGIMFRHFKIPFLYCNEDGKLDDYPYKL
ncbi:26171_t:CDS:2 [Gigaspora margarita]|uniref:26171_t:CDS:1 n=1 Tax=Gigaspora margarita TaxID=4874 RepID=A0ABN7VDW7_GIGMA|nr:26171_t:CDS:2 [Gigaspora margarita]